MKLWTIWFLLLLPFPCWADASAAFNDGKSLGHAVNPRNLGIISAGSIQDKLPAYGQSVAETGYFQGGHGDTAGPGAGKVSLCATVTPDSDPIRRQECEAVNFLARNPDIRPQLSITGSDPIIIGARASRNSAVAVFLSSGINGGLGSNSLCGTGVETTPAQTMIETCSSIRELTTEQCTMERIINIDADANFQCVQSFNAYDTKTCRRSYLDAVGSGQCSSVGCQLSESICVDTTASKQISGVTVTLAEVGGCWEYEDTYTCLRPNAVNACQPFVTLQPMCWQTDSRCDQSDSIFNSGCMRSTQTWRCGDASMATPADTTRLADSHTLISSNYDPLPCQSLTRNTNCQIAESTCLSTTPPNLPPDISPADVAPDGCYKKQNFYVCLTGHTDPSECDRLAANPYCSLQSLVCGSSETVAGQCPLEQRTYQCVSTPAQTNPVTDCSAQVFCHNGNCFDRGYPNDNDFARSMALMEAAREAGVYGSEMEIFKGFDSRCRIKLFGLLNCCKKSSGGENFSNSNLMGTALSVGGQAIDVGSSYVYDALYDAPTLQQGLGAALGALGADGLFNPSFSFYGFSFQFLPSQGFVFTGFDPTTLAIQIALIILQELLSCQQDEQILAMRRGQNLCREIGTYCSKKLKLAFTSICIEHTKSHCCYNSRLARIINEQGRGQIGKSWGSAKNPNCSGFTTAEFASLDFSRIDLSEFMAEVMANIKMPNVGTMGQQIQGTVQQKVKDYYQR